jgi:hypothetical protein
MNQTKTASCCNTVVRKVCSVDAKLPGDPWIHLCKDGFDVSLFFNYRNNVLLKNNRRNSLIPMTLRLPVGYPRTKRQFILIKFKACQVSLHVLLVCIRSYLKSVMENTFLNIGYPQPTMLYLRQQKCEGPCLFFETKRGPRVKKFGKYCCKWIAGDHDSQ